MSGALLPFFLGFVFGKASGGFHLFGGASPINYRGLPPHEVHPSPVVAPEHMVPVTTSTAVHWTSNAPSGLPPFPSGWKPAHTDSAVVSRAWSLMGLLPEGQTKYERGPGGGWLAYHASKSGGKKYVTAWEPRGQQGVVTS